MRNLQTYEGFLGFGNNNYVIYYIMKHFTTKNTAKNTGYSKTYSYSKDSSFVLKAKNEEDAKNKFEELMNITNVNGYPSSKYEIIGIKRTKSKIILNVPSLVGDIDNKEKERLKYLLDSKNTTNDDMCGAVIYLSSQSEFNKFDYLDMILDKMDKDKCIYDDQFDKNPTEMAILKNNIKLLDYLIDKGVRLKIPNIISKTEQKEVLSLLKSYDFQKKYIEMNPTWYNDISDNILRDDIKTEYEHLLDSDELGLL